MAAQFRDRTDPNWSHTGGGPGDVFVKSAAYQKIADPAGRGQQWTHGPGRGCRSRCMLHKGTLLENVGGGGPGGGLVPPFYEPGVVDKLFEPLGVADVFGQSTVSASQVRYVVEGTATNAAAGVAEARHEARVDARLYRDDRGDQEDRHGAPDLATRCSRTARRSRAYLNGRLSLFVKIEEERQLLRGAGSSNELLGIMGRPGINRYTRLAADDNTVALAKVIANTAGSASSSRTR